MAGETMVEKAIRAGCTAADVHLACSYPSCTCNIAPKIVLGALRALREPTEEMVDALYDADLDIYWGYSADGSPGGPRDVWRVMIDAALKEKP